MKLMITAMSEKSEEETSEEMLNDGCDVIENILCYVDENLKGFVWSDIKCMANSTTLIFEK